MPIETRLCCSSGQRTSPVNLGQSQSLYKLKEICYDSQLSFSTVILTELLESIP
jgi:hypothetical protein